MIAWDFLLPASGSTGSTGRSRHSNRFPPDYDDLEPRELLSAVQAAMSSNTTAPQIVGSLAGVGPAVGALGMPGAGGTVVAQAPGSVGFLQSELPVDELIADLSLSGENVATSGGPISVTEGLLSLPSSPLLTPTVTENETPLNNGTPITGTVWITEPPEPDGLFHFGTTISPVFSHLYLQTVNPQGGPPSFTYLGEDSDGSPNGTAVEEPVAVGPVGPSITVEIHPVQPPSVVAQQLLGPPPQVQQGETTLRQDARTPPGGGAPGTPGQAAVPGQGGRIMGLAPQRGIGAGAPHLPRILSVRPSTGWGPQFPPRLAPPPRGQQAPAPVQPPTLGREAVPAPQLPTRRPPAIPPAQPPSGGVQGQPGTKPPATQPPAGRGATPPANGAPGTPAVPRAPAPSPEVQGAPRPRPPAE
jgi:hypothetical protein